MVLYIGDKPVGLMKVVEKKVPKTKFGVSIDGMIGGVDSSGTYIVPDVDMVVDFSGVKHIKTSDLAYAFYRKRVKKVNLNDLVSCAGSCCSYMCSSVIGTTSENPLVISVDSIEAITASNAFSYVATGVIHLAPSFKKLRVVAASDVFSGAFGAAKVQPDKVFPVLEEVSGNGAFSNFRSLNTGDKIYFSKIKKIVGGASYSATVQCYSKVKFYYPRLTEVSQYIAYSSGVSEFHFAKAHQALLEACEGYSYKWCGGNPDIYFDLMLKITVNGTVYEREHTIDNYTSWSDGNGNLVYTYAETEPDVGTVVYSDQGTTQVGIVTEAA